MYLVAGTAAFCLDRNVLEHKRTLHVSVAAEAKLVPFRRSPQRVRQRAAMYVMAIGTLEQAFVDSVPERHAEVGLRFRVTSVAKGWLFFGQKLALFLGEVRRVARRAGDSIGSVSGVFEPGVLLLARMTTQASLCHCLRSSFLEIEYLRLVTATVDVLRPRTMAGFTAVCLGPTLIFQEIVPVTSLLETIEDVFVAGFTRVGTHVFRGSQLLSRLGGLIFRRCLCTGESHDHKCGNCWCRCKPTKAFQEFHSPCSSMRFRFQERLSPIPLSS